jgi:hypothetical protein
MRTSHEDTAIALCRHDHMGVCRCERNGGEVCLRYMREVATMTDLLIGSRQAIELPTARIKAQS